MLPQVDWSKHWVLPLPQAGDNYDEDIEILAVFMALLVFATKTNVHCVGMLLKVMTLKITLDQPKESGRSSKRAFHMKQPILEPYSKKPKMTMFDYEIKKIPRPLKLTNIEYRDQWRIQGGGGPGVLTPTSE